MATSYTPRSLPIENLDYRRLIRLVGEANAELARYDGLLQSIVNPVVMLSPLTTQEAVLSSRIEGTQATLDDVLEQEAGLRKDERSSQDIQEIINYRHALMTAKDVLIDRPITLHLIREMHKILMASVRGHNKSPGAFRREQNWIGPPGTPVEQATFVPPAPLIMEDALRNWEGYLHGEGIDVLIQTAVVHAQFELIHPFMDGNGRIGRLLIPLFLFQKKRLSNPMFYLSAYLEHNREEYYGRLRAISDQDDWDGWVEFFLRAVRIQAQDNAQRVRAILELYERMKREIVKITHSQYAIQLIDALFNRPIFQTGDFIDRLGIPKPTAKLLLRKIRTTGILTPLREASGRRSAVLAFPELLNIAEGRTLLDGVSDR